MPIKRIGPNPTKLCSILPDPIAPPLRLPVLRARGEGRSVSLTCGGGHFAGIDLGIGKYHFAAGAGKENFVWT